MSFFIQKMYHFLFKKCIIFYSKNVSFFIQKMYHFLFKNVSFLITRFILKTNNKTYN
jgi:hypothetical protein